VIWAIVK